MFAFKCELFLKADTDGFMDGQIVGPELQFCGWTLHYESECVRVRFLTSDPVVPLSICNMKQVVSVIL